MAAGTVNLRSCGRSANHISLIRHTRPGESRRRTGENRPRIAQVDSAQEATAETAGVRVELATTQADAAAVQRGAEVDREALTSMSRDLERHRDDARAERDALRAAHAEQTRPIAAQRRRACPSTHRGPGRRQGSRRNLSRPTHDSQHKHRQTPRQRELPTAGLPQQAVRHGRPRPSLRTCPRCPGASVHPAPGQTSGELLAIRSHAVEAGL